MTKKLLGYLAVLLGAMGLCAGAMAETETSPLPAPKAERYNNMVTFNFGTLGLSNSSQDWNITGPYYTSSGGCLFLIFVCSGPSSGYTWGPLPNHFDTAARRVFGVEYERRFLDITGYGIDYFQMKNSFVIPSVTPVAGDVTTQFAFVYLKRYLAYPDGLRPYFSLGLGIFRSSFRGYINREAGGNATKAVLGLSYETGRMRFIAEYRKIDAYSITALGSSPVQTGDVFGGLDMSGSGTFFGLGTAF